MLSPDEIRKLCLAIRYDNVRTDDTLTETIKSEVDEYRTLLKSPRTQLPPEELRERLPLLGWLIYEASWEAVQRVAAAFETLTGPARAESDLAFGHIVRIDEAARGLPWPEFAPRALGAIRAHALAESKRDTEPGYDRAWILHQDARKRHQELLDSHGGSAGRERYLLDLEEILLQLALAETGTACRTAERVIGRWAEELEKPDPAWTELDSPRWTQRMFHALDEGVTTGELAMATVSGIQEKYQLAEKVDEYRLAMVTGFQNPGIMTARAALLLLALCPEMQRLRPAARDWPVFGPQLLARFERAYRHIERPVSKTDGTPVPMRMEYRRSLVQIRLNLALLMPGYDLPSSQTFHPCLALNPLDQDAVAALSAWLAHGDDGRRRGDANVIGSATMPGFIRSVVACSGGSSHYHRWREQWFELDRYASEPGRRDRVTAALHAGR